MPGTLQPTYWTADMARALPDDGMRYEVVHGELLVTPAPRGWHQELVGRLYVALRTWLRTEPVGHPMLSPADLSWDVGTLVQPDLFVVPLVEARTLDWARMQHLLLVVEVLSTATSRYDRFTKRRRYQEAGVPVYWIVDPDEHLVEVWKPDDQFPRIEREALVWEPAGVGAPFVLDLAELFKPL
jgi:Uma2 family endonuclease